jgi:type I restriction enzyme S subunit
MSSTRKGWTRLQFGDVVENVNDQPKRATLPLVTRYIAGEHVDENRLTIDRWGTLGDDLVPPTFKRRFQPGDVLFHSRNLKKIAVPDFGGITGEKLFVLRSRSPSLLQDFVPYLLLSPAFTAYAEASWSGSVNKFLNWTPLERYEFDLPPIEKQRRLAHIFKANRLVADRHYDAAKSAARLFRSRLEDVFARLDTDPSSPKQALGEIARVERGQFTHRPRNLPQFFGGPYPFVQTGDVAASQGYLHQASQTLSDEGKSYSRSFPRDTILITIAAVIGATAITTGETWCPDSVVGIQPDTKKIRVRYLEFALRHARSFLDGKVATQTAQKNINLAVLRPLPIPVPSLSTQLDIEHELAILEQTVQAIGRRTTTASDLMRVINSGDKT